MSRTMNAHAAAASRLSNRLVTYFNRYTDRIEEEAVYGESWLRWAYGSPVGRCVLWPLARFGWFSRWYGWRMRRRASSRKIRPFMARYGVDSREFADPVERFQCFNDFFTRALRPDARPIDSDPESVVFPADGRHLGFQDFGRVGGIFVKGEVFSLQALLGPHVDVAPYRRGSVVISRLCPTDYHRFHFPIAGTPGGAELIPGPLYSVNPIALRRNIHILTRNKRMLTPLETERMGRVLLVEVGATCVGTICQSYAPHQATAKGVEKGWFAFGGSTVITLFREGAVTLADDLCRQTELGRELYARMGDRMGTIVATTRRSG